MWVDRIAFFVAIPHHTLKKNRGLPRCLKHSMGNPR